MVRSGAGGGLLHHLFSARTLRLFDELSEDDAPSYLSGMLIGADVRVMTQQAGTGGVCVVGEGAAFDAYGHALDALGVPLAVLQQHNQPIEQSCVLFIGTRFIGEVTQEAYKGEMRSNIDGVEPLGSPMGFAAAAPAAVEHRTPGRPRGRWWPAPLRWPARSPTTPEDGRDTCSRRS